MTATPSLDRADLHTRADSAIWTRIAGVCGVVAAVLWFGMGAAIASSGPVIGDSASDIRAWMLDNQGSVAVFTLGMGLAVTLLLVFGAALRSELARVDRTGYMSNLFFGALVANVGGGLVGLSFWATLSHDSVVGLSDDVIVALSALDTVFFFALLPWTFVAMVSAASIVIIQTRIMPTWLGGLGFVVSAAGAISTLWLISGDAESFLAAGPGLIAFIGTLLWIAITGVFLARGETA